MKFTDKLQCPGCGGEDNIYWHSENTSKCHTCDIWGEDDIFIVDNTRTQEESNE